MYIPDLTVSIYDLNKQRGFPRNSFTKIFLKLSDVSPWKIMECNSIIFEKECQKINFYNSYCDEHSTLRITAYPQIRDWICGDFTTINSTFYVSYTFYFLYFLYFHTKLVWILLHYLEQFHHATSVLPDISIVPAA